MKINVLGTAYDICYSEESSENYDAVCDTSIKKITIFKNQEPSGEHTKKDLEYVKKDLTP